MVRTDAEAGEPSGAEGVDEPDDPTATDPAARAAAVYPGAIRPDRRRRVDAGGVSLAVAEWGDEDAPPLLMAHGGFDFTGTLDVFAPLLAAAGWRVVSWDQRGHGDSDHTHLYSVDADLRDAVAVLDSVSSQPIPLIGHSKGGVLLLQVCDALPHRVSHMVNLDGVPSDRNWPDIPEHNRTRLLVGELDGWLGHRHRAGTKVRRPGTIDELAERRRQMNPRLSMAWLRYLVTRGARLDDDGWRWKLDPVLRFGGFGPWRPEWTAGRLAAIGRPVLCVLGLEAEPLAWGTLPEDVKRFLPPQGRLVPLDATGHFVHIEKPQVVADLVLDFLPDVRP